MSNLVDNRVIMYSVVVRNDLSLDLKTSKTDRDTILS